MMLQAGRNATIVTLGVGVLTATAVACVRMFYPGTTQPLKDVKTTAGEGEGQNPERRMISFDDSDGQEIEFLVAVMRAVANSAESAQGKLEEKNSALKYTVERLNAVMAENSTQQQTISEQEKKIARLKQELSQYGVENGVHFSAQVCS